jgi:hypothetical protein
MRTRLETPWNPLDYWFLPVALRVFPACCSPNFSHKKTLFDTATHFSGSGICGQGIIGILKMVFFQ